MDSGSTYRLYLFIGVMALIKVKPGRSGPEIIKLEFIIKLKIKRNDWIGCLWTCVCKQPILALYFEFETVLKFYNLRARYLLK